MMDQRSEMDPSGRAWRGLASLAAVLLVAGCSSMDCGDPTRYIGAELHKPIVVPQGLDPVATTETFKVPGGDAPQDYPGGACLAKPPQLIAPPAEAPPAEAPPPAQG